MCRVALSCWIPPNGGFLPAQLLWSQQVQPGGGTRSMQSWWGSRGGTELSPSDLTRPDMTWCCTLSCSFLLFWPHHIGRWRPPGLGRWVLYQDLCFNVPYMCWSPVTPSAWAAWVATEREILCVRVQGGRPPHSEEHPFRESPLGVKLLGERAGNQVAV